jgi:hypothetical protein
MLGLPKTTAASLTSHPFAGSLLQSANPVLHTKEVEHTLLMQFGSALVAAVHALPQLPQLAPLVRRSVCTSSSMVEGG